MTLSNQRKGEIALKIVREMLSHEGIRFDSFKRDIGNKAKRLGVSEEELLQFSKEIIRELYEKTFAENSERSAGTIHGD